MADSTRFARVKAIVRSDPSRRVIVVSAGGKRHACDFKMTDALYLCHAHLQYGFSCRRIWEKIRRRILTIRDELDLHTDVERQLDAIYAALGPDTPQDWLVCRGEYLAALLMAEYLDYTFVDSAEWLQFDEYGCVCKEASYAALQRKAEGRCIVTPGFYGVMPDGAIRTFSRGGSDITGSLAAAALGADLCENWTDVPGVLEADPQIVPEARPIAHLHYAQLAALTEAGMQVLHESAVEPLRERNIPLRICSSFHPELPGTRISNDERDRNLRALVAFAGKREEGTISALCTPAAADSIRFALRQAGILPLSDCYAGGMLELTVPQKQYAQTLAAAYGAVKT